MEAVITKELLKNAMSFEQYLNLLDGLLKEGKTTGNDQSEYVLNYARMNDKRMKKWMKIGKINPETQEGILKINAPLTLLVIAEGWCGDAAQILPFVYKMTQFNPLLEMKVILRDEHPEVMDQFLTDGGRSIPKIIGLNPEDLTVLGDWGPRPTVIQNEFFENKKTQERSPEEFAEYVHLWYAKNKGVALQNDFLAKLELWNKKQQSLPVQAD
ncbi:thioredoxin family protein [Roseivirga echinicomitans]